MNSRHIHYFVTQAGSAIWRSPLVQLVAISTTTVSLTVLCALITLTSNVDRLAERWSRGLGVVAFLAEGVPDSKLARIAEQIKAWPEVESTTAYTRKSALSDLRNALGKDRALLSGIDSTVLPASIEVVLEPKHRTVEARERLATKLRTKIDFGHIETVDFGADMADRMGRVRELLHIGGLAIAFLVLSAVIFIITNTVRLTLFARRDEIDVMRLVGAKTWFIRVPFYLEGAFQGIVSATCAVGLTWAGTQMIPTTQFVSSVSTHLPELEFISSSISAAVILGAGLMGIVASHLATGRFLKENA
jgi:cell division transport system permease protein